MKKAIFNTVTAFGLVHGNDNAKTFSIDYFNACGFASMQKTSKAHKLFNGLAENFETGQKPLVKTLNHKSGLAVLCVAGNGVFCHVTLANGETFARKASIDNTVKNFRKVKAIIGKLLRKNDLPKSNMLQTRVCNEIVNL
jgi:hypothetical protein